MRTSIRTALLLRLLFIIAFVFLATLFGGLAFQDHQIRQHLPLPQAHHILYMQALQQAHRNLIWEACLVFFLIALPLIACLSWWIVRASLLPIHNTALEIGRRSNHNLSPLPKKRIPKEIKPLTDALNQLFSQLKDSFDREQRFAGDAAHELRTPLAVLNTHVQLADQTEDKTKREEHLNHAKQGVARCTHIIEQLLNISRMSPQTSINTEPVNLNQAIQNTIADLVPRALEKNIEVTFYPHKHPVPMVDGNATSLGILIRNLVDNAVRYTPANGKVIVRTVCQNGLCELSVEDNGPGIAKEKRERVFDRFYRELGNQEIGCGLGLGIVKQIADLHNATIALAQASFSTGLLIRIHFEN